MAQINSRFIAHQRMLFSLLFERLSIRINSYVALNRITWVENEAQLMGSVMRFCVLLTEANWAFKNCPENPANNRRQQKCKSNILVYVGDLAWLLLCELHKWKLFYCWTTTHMWRAQLITQNISQNAQFQSRSGLQRTKAALEGRRREHLKCE